MKQSNTTTIEPQHFESLYPLSAQIDAITKVLASIKEGHSCEVLSLPDGGRSTFLGLLAYNKQLKIHHLQENEKWFHFVLIDFSEVRGKSLLDAYKLLFLELMDSLRERNFQEEYTAAKTLFSEALSFHDDLVLFQSLKKCIEYLSLEKKLTVVLLFDRFEDYLPMLTPVFFTNLRVLRNHAKYRFSAIFSLSKPLADILDPLITADFSEYVSATPVILPLFDEPSLSFRISYIEKVTEKNLSKETQKKILTSTSGHAKLTRLLIELVLQDSVILNLFQDQEIPDQVRNDKLTQQKSIHEALQSIWEVFSPAEKSHFLKDLFDQQYADEHTKYLEAIGIVKNKQITIPLFQTFVQEQKKLVLTEKKSLTYDVKTNTILQNKLDISDKFTATEFRLLTFLLQKENSIIDREHIIQNVWSDTKTTVGVTDQALDQLIFRLRKKIEEDPNSPIHIQTVKGRGFSFTP